LISQSFIFTNSQKILENILKIKTTVIIFYLLANLMLALAIPTWILGVFLSNNEVLITKFLENLYWHEPINSYEK
jgi:hypothetical protein